MNKPILLIIFSIIYSLNLKPSSSDSSWTPSLSSISESAFECFEEEFEEKKTRLKIKIIDETIVYETSDLIIKLNNELNRIYDSCKPYDKAGNRITPQNFATYKNNFQKIAQELINRLQSISIINCPIHFGRNQIIQILVDKIKHKQKKFKLLLKQVQIFAI